MALPVASGYQPKQVADEAEQRVALLREERVEALLQRERALRVRHVCGCVAASTQPRVAAQRGSNFCST